MSIDMEQVLSVTQGDILRAAQLYRQLDGLSLKKAGWSRNNELRNAARMMQHHQQRTGIRLYSEDMLQRWMNFTDGE